MNENTLVLIGLYMFVFGLYPDKGWTVSHYIGVFSGVGYLILAVAIAVWRKG